MERAGGERVLRAGLLDSLPVGQGRLVRHGSRPLLVIRPRPDQIVALSGICTHLRCVLHWDAERSIVACPCHAGAFDLRGNVLAGPPGEPLPQYHAEVRGGEIVIHL
jgi:cytochrome b6-f complex iron-sulfur subunit